MHKRIAQLIIPGVLGIVIGSIAISYWPLNDASIASITATPTAAATSTPLPTTPTVMPTLAASLAPPLVLAAGVSGIGEVKAIQDADLTFRVSGTVAEVYVQEGDTVSQGQLLAILDVRPLNQRVLQAESSLADAVARQAALTEAPLEFEVRAARARIAEAEAALAELEAGPKAQDIQNAESQVEQARINLQTRRDQLSVAKTDAELRIEQAANAVRDAQAEYSQIYWSNRELENELARFNRELPQENRDREEATLRAINNAEQALEQAKLALEQAQQAEITGIQAAEQEVVQAEAALAKLLLPPDQDRLAAARSAIAQAQAAHDRLFPNPTNSDRNRAAAAIAQAESQLQVALLEREYAELTAPFDGVVSIVNIDPGNSVSPAGQPAIRLVDLRELYVEVEITDIDIARVTLGQRADILVEAFPDRTFSGRVSYIAPSATVKSGVRTFKVQIALDNPEGLKDGMSARVELHAER